MTLTTPPNELDSAEVICWAVSNRGGFYQLQGAEPPITVCALVVARYADGGHYYLFKCDEDWQVVQDWDCGDLDEAQEIAAQHSAGEPLTWQTWS